MFRRLPTFAFALVLTSSALAQQPAPAAPVASTRCGGVLCDLYYSGKPAPAPGQPDTVPDPTHLPCHDFLCAAFGGRTADAAPPPEPATPVPASETAKPARHKKAHKKVAATETATGKADLAK